jgi:hypothetical protein
MSADSDPREPNPVILTATAVYPYVDRDRATAALRGQLRETVAGAGAGVPDWTTLVVEGPTEVEGHHRRVWFVWTATGEPNCPDTSPEGGLSDIRAREKC